MEGKYVTTDSTWFLNLTTNTTTQDSDNFLYGFPGKYSPYSTPTAIFLALLLGSIIIGTIIGNILVCIAVKKVRKLRKPCNYLLVSLAVSDLSVAILVMPLSVIYEIWGSWPLGSIMCDFWVSLDVLSCTASILNLCAISVDRYKAITKPLEYTVKRTPRRMGVWIALVWCMAGCISVAPLLILGNEYKTSETGRIDCNVCQNSWYQFYATMVSFYFPTAVMIYVYCMIYMAAHKIVLEEIRAQNHLEAHCYMDIEPQQNLSVPVITRPNNSDEQTTRTSSPLKQHRSSSASTTGRPRQHATVVSCKNPFKSLYCSRS
ncbi:5-hydroxytryptamine receptor 1-like [Leptopilina boulardi]|uniref:5-hydroxytryptamine receptor 1-like n=1 Tax=Leptopilina boulardi TaxID=63433 RepID=UPI0021F57398|nr:5-hydroxytryptamine receptor 1-like [Leptopilina boulardi]XP_051160058.1 5-hydroxytryptamine receptor 1-like [Leptopilina boulardi]XP_051160059.1 5-hydroxytryptamine receptor 1-like [Leptopilina boulardi]XP_051160060.1 5-hydroxytryptamine receptor 1-like [Leptopilina boulardi]XP_051160061.1 5-hydroxytryptamine receptor 1-like [Leptopilina boulardi]XP_051160062.1 5-hydroxytryptamine receptor 1-like [Leptopilina boulardi]XP_051160063.1 5-hydroxytryptamine receptor 1-like [Leptopilina boulard